MSVPQLLRPTDDAYVYAPEEVDAINAALVTGRPLLVTGPAGSGKSALAQDAARQLGRRFLDYALNADTKSQDLLWHHDELQRMNDAQAARLREPSAYLRRGIVWEALVSGNAQPAVLVLEDVDQATDPVIDMLVQVLGQFRFVVRPTGEVVSADAATRPLVLLTAAGDRRLPPRLIGLCWQLRLAPPDGARLLSIAAAHGLGEQPERTRLIADRVLLARRADERRSSVRDFLDMLRMAQNLNLPLDERLFWADSDEPRREEPAVPPVKVFLCHSWGDKEAVRELYRRMQADGLAPWLDEEDIPAGADWDSTIKQAVRTADLVVVCLSQAAITKSGYVQREIRIALDAAEEKPDGRIYIIPARIEPCDVPQRLGRYQWVDLFDPGGYGRLLRSVRAVQDLAVPPAEPAPPPSPRPVTETPIAQKRTPLPSSKTPPTTPARPRSGKRDPSLLDPGAIPGSVGNADVLWDSLDADSYFAHNYSRLGHDDAQVITIVADFFERVGHSGEVGRAVDVGSGTNLYPALTMLPFAYEISLYARAVSERRWLSDALHNPQESWSAFWSAIAGGRMPYQRIREPFDLLARRARITKGSVFDLRPEQFDIGTMFFVAESITTRADEFQRAVMQFVGSLRSRAPFAAAFMRNSSGYRVGNQMFPACPIDGMDVKRAFAPVARIDLADVSYDHEPRSGYSGMIVVTGRKR
ncbi:SCO2525 family SAM-dependent methyltransferase [Actinoplanes sp. NPDC049548]|uniref:SCO2525 family SAM-dependent methyltransferase n=1 Tax=Actinoplanes sp. NPDC049548 TaxID=3155152 RepID=UPI0034483355